ncbi:MAG: hypothetical protein ACT4OX_13490 [Actinomycetota bacterium]
MSADPWAEALDDFEACLVRSEAVLDLGAKVEPPAGFTPPVIEEPLPAELIARAAALLERAAEIQRRIVDEQARIREELTRLPRNRPAASPAGARFEFQA